MAEADIKTLDDKGLRKRMEQAQKRIEAAERDAEQARVEQVHCALRLGNGYLLRAAQWLGWHHVTLSRFLKAHPELGVSVRPPGRPRS